MNYYIFCETPISITK